MLGEDHLEGAGCEKGRTKLFVERGEADDPRAGQYAAQDRCCLYSIHPRHAQVQNHQVGCALLGFLDGSNAILSLAAGLERGGPSDEVADGAAHRGAVIDDEDSRRSRRWHGRRNYQGLQSKAIRLFGDFRCIYPPPFASWGRD
jgi:hypothetical protein